MEIVKNLTALVLIVFTGLASWDIVFKDSALNNSDFVVLMVAFLIIIGFAEAIRKSLKNGKDSSQESSLSEH